MADYREQRHWGRNDPGGFDDRGYEQHGGQRREQERSFGGFGRGSSRDRMGAEQFRPEDDRGIGEQAYRDYGRGQPGGAYEHSGPRDYRHGSGYGGFGEAPGESGGGFGSGRTYAAEPGWGPDYGEYGNGYGGARRHEGEGAHPGSYGTQRSRFDEVRRRSEDRYGREQFGHDRRRGDASRGYGPSAEGLRGMGPNAYGDEYRRGFGEAGHTYAQQGFGDAQYGGQSPQGGQRYGRGPKGYQRSDERLQEDISERLMAAAYIDASEVTVAVQDGKVTLEGTVTERRMKHRIEDLVDDCMGVKDIDNRIRVAPGGGPGSETHLSIGGS